jgi:hypothetical protein
MSVKEGDTLIADLDKENGKLTFELKKKEEAENPEIV